MKGTVRRIVLIVSATGHRIEFLAGELTYPCGNMFPQLSGRLFIAASKLVNPARDGFVVHNLLIQGI